MNGNGNPFRSSWPGGTFAYGCPPIDTPPLPPDFTPLPIKPFDPGILKPETWAFRVCTKCNQHVRTMEPCPFCLRSELDALKRALGDAAKPVETIETLRVALRKAIGALRDISRVTGAGLEPLIAECEIALDAKET